MNEQNVYTAADLAEMWKRPVERQYNIAISKMLEAIIATEGDIRIAFSGGKDSSLLLDMYCEIVSTTPWKDKPVCVSFADTTNETSAMMKFVKEFIKYEEKKWGVSIDFTAVRPPNKLTWAKFVKENGIPLISKDQSKRIRAVKADMMRNGIDIESVTKLYMGGMDAVRELQSFGFSATSILALTGYVSSRGEFGEKFRLSRKWLPMVGWLPDRSH